MGQGGEQGLRPLPGALSASRGFHPVLTALAFNPVSCQEPTPHAPLISSVVLSPLHPSFKRKKNHMTGGKRVYEPTTGRLVGDGQGVEVGSSESLCFQRKREPERCKEAVLSVSNNGCRWDMVQFLGPPPLPPPPVKKDIRSQTPSPRQAGQAPPLRAPASFHQRVHPSHNTFLLESY